MECTCFEPRIDADEAAERTARLTATTLLLSTVRSLFGRDDNPTVSVRYYPDYLAYTTVTLRRLGRSNTDKKFIAAVDAVTGRVGEVDVTLPAMETRELDPDHVVSVEIDPEGAEIEWNEWLFSYVNRTYRPVKRPETSLDSLKLVYTPYYIVDFGADGECYAVSALTKQPELLEDLPPLRATYDRIEG